MAELFLPRRQRKDLVPFHVEGKGWKEEYINAGQRGPRVTWQRGMNHRDLLGAVPTNERYSGVLLLTQPSVQPVH